MLCSGDDDMEQTLTAKLQIVVQPSHSQLLLDTMKAYRAACNYVSEQIYHTHDLKHNSLNRALYQELRNRFGLRSQMAQSVLKTVVAKYKTIRENRHGWIRPVFKQPQYDLVWNRDYSLSTKDRTFSVNTLEGRIKVSFFQNGPANRLPAVCRFGTAKLVSRHGKFYLYIPYTYEVDDLKTEDIANVVGIDRGIRFLAVTYDSKGKSRFYDGKTAAQKRAHYKTLRARLQKTGTPSSKRRLKAIGQRENRWMRDVNHCVSKALVTSNPAGTIFVLEDLKGIRSATERIHIKKRYISVSWSFYDLEQTLTYKAARNKQMIVKVDPSYTSQTCPKCGHIERSNRNKRIHLFCCNQCGYRSNDDRIVASPLFKIHSWI